MECHESLIRANSVASFFGLSMIPSAPENSASQEKEAPDPAQLAGDFDNRKRRILFYLLLTVAANAIFDVLVSLPYRDPSFIVFATTGLAAFFAYAWVVVDAEERQLNLNAWGCSIAILTKFALPIYFFYSRGFLGGLKACLWTLLFLALLTAEYVALALLTAQIWN